MTWLKRILVGLGIALVLLIALVLFVRGWSTIDETTQAITMTVGGRTITIAGHYKNFTQEYAPDGIKIVVDGHEIIVSADQLTVDGETQVLEPDQDVTIYVSEDGEVQVKVVPRDGGGTDPPAE